MHLMKKLVPIVLAFCLLAGAIPVSADGLGTGYVTADVLNIRALPSTGAQIVGKIKYGGALQLLSLEGEWYKVLLSSGLEAYVCAQYVSFQAAALPSRDDAKRPATNGELLVAYAKQYMGYKYVYGGNGPKGFDCSGFTYYLMSDKFGVTLNRRASQQALQGTAVAKENLIAGDLVFFSSNNTSSVTHVGIYIGGGEFIHASSARACICVSSLSDSYYTKHYKGANRILS